MTEDKAVPLFRRAVPLWAALVCLAAGGAVGFGAGVASVKAARDFFRDVARREKRADVRAPKQVERPAFRFSYPGNWTIDTQDKDYDPDRSLTIHSPGQSLFMLMVADELDDTKSKLERHVAAQLANTLKDAKRAPFDRWGRFRGEGALLTGRYVGFTTGTIHVFVFGGGGHTFTVLASTYDDDRANVEPGFRLIEKTFEVTAADPR